MPLRNVKYCNDLFSALDELERLHDAATVQAHQNYYLKLALLELCGWVEETQDAVIGRVSGYWLVSYHKEFADEINRNYGFAYKKNMRGLLLKLVGFKGVEAVEDRLENHRDTQVVQSFLKMCAYLDEILKIPRNAHAHTFAGISAQPLQHALHFSTLRDAARTIDIGLQLVEAEVSRC